MSDENEVVPEKSMEESIKELTVDDCVEVQAEKPLKKKKRKKNKKNKSAAALAVIGALQQDVSGHIHTFNSVVESVRAQSGTILQPPKAGEMLIGGPFVIGLAGVDLPGVKSEVTKARRTKPKRFIIPKEWMDVSDVPQNLMELVEDMFSDIAASSLIGSDEGTRLDGNSNITVDTLLKNYILERQGMMRYPMGGIVPPGSLMFNQSIMTGYGRTGGLLTEAMTSKGFVIRVHPDKYGVVDLEKNLLKDGALSEASTLSMHAIALLVAHSLTGIVLIKVEPVADVSLGAHETLFVTNVGMYRRSLCRSLEKAPKALENDEDLAAASRIVTFEHAEADIARCLLDPSFVVPMETCGEDLRLFGKMAFTRSSIPAMPRMLNLYRYPVIVTTPPHKDENTSDLPTITLPVPGSSGSNLVVVASAVYAKHTEHVEIVLDGRETMRGHNVDRTILPIGSVPSIRDIVIDEGVAANRDGILMPERMCIQASRLARRVPIYTLSETNTIVMKVSTKDPVWALMDAKNGSIGDVDDNGEVYVFLTTCPEKVFEW